MAKKLYVVGNWKMHKTARQATDAIEALVQKVAGSKVKIYLSVPFTAIAAAAQAAKETEIVIGAQNMSDAREGAFTGEIAGLMLKEAGASFVLLGHSERRHVFGEDNGLIHKKVVRALQDDIQPILCIGESGEERQKGETDAVLREQLASALAGVPAEDAQNIMIAYEPVWAIGSGKTPTPDQIEEVHSSCREWLVEAFGSAKAGAIPILYGGSVKSANAAEIAAQKDVDGVLVGQASLDAEALAAIIHSIERASVPKKRKPRVKKEKEE